MGNWELVVGLCVSLLRARNGHHGAFGRRYLSFSLLLSSPPPSHLHIQTNVLGGAGEGGEGGKEEKRKRGGGFFSEAGEGGGVGKASPNFPVLSHQHLFFSRRSFPSLLFLKCRSRKNKCLHFSSDFFKIFS